MFGVNSRKYNPIDALASIRLEPSTMGLMVTMRISYIPVQ
jgi:hypothetical protein